ncbi:MAG: hypothetical protein H8K04_07755 [Nitrospira sp.]
MQQGEDQEVRPIRARLIPVLEPLGGAILEQGVHQGTGAQLVVRARPVVRVHPVARDRVAVWVRLVVWVAAESRVCL